MILLRYGNTNTYYLNGLLLDTDLPGTVSGLFRELKRNGIGVEQLRYVLATHYHPDHMGLIGELMALGVKLLLIDRQVGFVRFSDPLFARQKVPVKPIRIEEATVISCAGSRAFLRTLGIAGEILPTDSHSPDGIALLTDDGNAFVGDLEPLSFLEGYEEGNLPLRADWERILSRKPSRVWFGHANPVRL